MLQSLEGHPKLPREEVVELKTQALSDLSNEGMAHEDMTHDAGLPQIQNSLKPHPSEGLSHVLPFRTP